MLHLNSTFVPLDKKLIFSSPITLSILTNGSSHAAVNVLVTCERPFSYDLLIGIDAIQALGGVMITLAREMKLVRGKEVCADLCVNEPDFDASFNHNEDMDCQVEMDPEQ